MLTEKLKNGDVTNSEKMRMMKDIMEGQNLSEKDFLDLMGTQFGDKTKAEMEEMLKSGMSMSQVLEHFRETLYFHLSRFDIRLRGLTSTFLPSLLLFRPLPLALSR